MRPWKVLLVDDEEEFVSALAERLQLRGLNALTATNGERALELVEEEAPDVVVLDVMMPGVGGLDVLQRITRRHPGTRVILLTGRGSLAEAAEGVRLGAMDYLMKPLEIEDLLQKMTQALGGRGGKEG
jgi:DNA-binding NtrC family response regulator